MCSGVGICKLVDDPTVVAVGARPTLCECDSGFVGGSCQLKCPHGDDGSVCGSGTCKLNNEKNIAECECPEG